MQCGSDKMISMIVSFVLLASSEKSSLLPKQEGSMDMLCRTLYGTAWEYGFVVRNMAEEILEFGSVMFMWGMHSLTDGKTS